MEGVRYSLSAALETLQQHGKHIVEGLEAVIWDTPKAFFDCGALQFAANANTYAFYQWLCKVLFGNEEYGSEGPLFFPALLFLSLL